MYHLKAKAFYTQAVGTEGDNQVVLIATRAVCHVVTRNQNVGHAISTIGCDDTLAAGPDMWSQLYGEEKGAIISFFYFV